MAAELERCLSQSSELIQGSGGIFEIEDGGALIFSKKALGRFPEDGEIVAIVKGIDAGLPIEQAKADAQKACPPPTFGQWFQKLLGKH